MSDTVKIVIVVLVGLPASGKTSFCDQFIEYCKKEGFKFNLFHICFDKMFKIDQSVIDNGQYKEMRKELFELVKHLVNDLLLKDRSPNFDQYTGDLTCNFYPEQNISYIIIDDNNYYRSMRHEFYRLAREASISFSQIYFGVDSTTAINRDSQRKSPVGKDTIHKMFLKLDKPIINNPWERNTIFIESTNINFHEIVKFLEDVSSKPEQPLNEKVNITPTEQSELHKIDLILRKSIHNIIKNTESTLRASSAITLQEKRKSILQDIRQGLISISNHNLTDFEQMLINN